VVLCQLVVLVTDVATQGLQLELELEGFGSRNALLAVRDDFPTGQAGLAIVGRQQRCHTLGALQLCIGVEPAQLARRHRRITCTTLLSHFIDKKAHIASSTIGITVVTGDAVLDQTRYVLVLPAVAQHRQAQQ
jgi:hypothetical protein